ncbi:MAG: hydrogenase iron-sulfur subunit [Polyangiaceae bacterium]
MTTLAPRDTTGEEAEAELELPDEPDSAQPVRLPVIDPRGERVEPLVRGERWLVAGDAWFQRLDRALGRFVPTELNPLAQTGAIANTALIVAIVSGVVLLIWYRTSVHLAHASVVSMGASRFGAGLVRSLHRYSSDLALAFVLLHALRLFVERRFGGVRWLAWVTGLVLFGLLWLVGWLGYWLVWDERGQLVALGSARLLDTLPIFADPLSRSFLVDDRLNSLLFFVVFFLHMLLPLAMGIALWLHITRLSRSWFLTGKAMTIWVVGALLVLSALAPADVVGPAAMAVPPRGFAMDYWYLAPLWLTDRLSGAMLWALVVGVALLVYPIPWLLARGKARVARVVEARCNACEKCYQDCPYDAIQMVPRKDDKAYPAVASVDPSKCVGCGICAGSCDSAGIGLEWFESIRQRHAIDGLVERARAAQPDCMLALACSESAGADLEVDPERHTSSELPGYVVVKIPCAGWVHPLNIERAIRRGARGVLVVACGPGGCRYREGARWTKERLAGSREPSLRRTKVAPEKVLMLELYRTERAELRARAARFASSHEKPPASPPSAGKRWLAGGVLAALFGVVTWAGTVAAYRAPSDPRPKLVVSFKHPGQAGENCREPSAEELAKLPPHMRQKRICERHRASVRLRVSVDGSVRWTHTYEPRGIWGDGNSIAIERLPLEPGAHDVTVEIGDSAKPDEFNHVGSRRVTLARGRNAVVLFDKVDGFVWHE